jgi:hypothetical protein
LSGGAEHSLQLFSVRGCQPQHRFKDARLVSATRVLRTQTILAQLPDVNNGAVSVGHLHNAMLTW